PETLRGEISRWTDQFSLAVAYCEMRGWGKLRDASDVPDPDERPVLARALAENPRDRWETCTAFVRELAGVAPRPERRNQNRPDWARGPALIRVAESDPSP